VRGQAITQPVECQRLGTAARKAAAHLVIGVIEKDGGTLYCTALFFGPDGSLLGKHRKTMPTAMERLIWGFGRRSDLLRAREAGVKGAARVLRVAKHRWRFGAELGGVSPTRRVARLLVDR